MAARPLSPNAVAAPDALHLHRRVLAALAEMRRDAGDRWRHHNPRLGKVFTDTRFALARAGDTLDPDESPNGHRQRLPVDALNLDGELAQALSAQQGGCRGGHSHLALG